MDNVFAELWREIVARPSGPMALRFYLQPLMATLLAIRDGWRAVRKIFFLALMLDAIYQLVVLHGLRPIQGLFVAAALALIPYVFLRGPANRLARILARSR